MLALAPCERERRAAGTLLFDIIESWSDSLTGTNSFLRRSMVISTLLFATLAFAQGTTFPKYRVANATGLYTALPWSFETNQGQLDPRVRFFSHGRSIHVYLTKDSLFISFPKVSQSRPVGIREHEANRNVLQMKV